MLLPSGRVVLMSPTRELAVGSIRFRSAEGTQETFKEIIKENLLLLHRCAARRLLRVVHNANNRLACYEETVLLLRVDDGGVERK